MTTVVSNPSLSPNLQNDVRWNLSELYESIKDPRIAIALDSAQARAEKFEKDYKGKINTPDLTAEILGAAIREYESLNQESSKPAYYASLLFTTDTSDPERGAFMQMVRERGTAMSLPMLFFDLELAAIPDSILDPLISDIQLAPYRHHIEQVRLYRDHMLTETEERLLEETANTGACAFRRLFSELTSNAIFHFDGGELNQAELISKLYSGDRAIRKRGAESLTNGLSSKLRSVVFIFNTLLQDKYVKDRLRRYEYAEESRHLGNELSKETVDLVVSTVTKNYPLVGRFYKVKRDILGVEELTHYDRYAPLFDVESSITFPKAKEIVLEAFGQFSPTLQRCAAEFFDKGWIDAPPAKGKEGGAYCQYVTPDLHPFVFMNFMGRMRDVMTLAHELGHGAHASLSREQSLLNFHGTLPLAELASTFGEMLVFEKVQAGAALKDRLAMYAEKIDDSFATIPRQTALYKFEMAIHEHRRTKGELAPEDFGEYWQREVQAMFQDSVSLGEDHKIWWSYINHFVGSPFYVYAYSFGELLALALYRQSQIGGRVFADKYINMLRCGGSMSPHDLMEQMGVNLDDPQFWQGGFDVLETLVTRFEELWAEYKKSL